MNTQSQGAQSPILRTLLIVAMILMAAILRAVPHPWNFAPIGAMALFSGATFRNRVVAFIFPLLAMLAGDFFIGFHILIPVVYASFLISVGIGLWLREHRTMARLGGAVLFGAMQFFLITNFGVWLFSNTYPKNAAGLLACYVAACHSSGIPLRATAFSPRFCLERFSWRSKPSRLFAWLPQKPDSSTPFPDCGISASAIIPVRHEQIRV